MTENRSDFRKSIKGPDAFQKRFRGYLESIRENPQVMVAIFLAILVPIGAYAGFSVWTNTKEERRIEALGQVNVLYEQETQAAEAKRELVLGELDEAQAALTTARADNNNEQIVALEQREQVLNEQLETIVADRATSLANFRTFFQENRNYPQGWAAGLMAVAAVLELEQLEVAKDLLIELLSASRGNDFYQTHARISLIGVLEDLGDYESALDEADILVARAPEMIKPQALLARGRVLILSGRSEEARQALSELEATYGDSPEAQQARTLQTLIRG